MCVQVFYEELNICPRIIDLYNSMRKLLLRIICHIYVVLCFSSVTSLVCLFCMIVYGLL